MNYRSFQITPKHIIFISLIGIVLILLIIKASWSSKEGMTSLERISILQKDISTKLQPTDVTKLKEDIDSGKTFFKISKEGEDKLLQLVTENNDKKNELKIRAEDILNKITKLQQVISQNNWGINNLTGTRTASGKSAEERISDYKIIISKSENEITSYLDEYTNLENTYQSWVKNEFLPRQTTIMKDYKMPTGQVTSPQQPQQVTDTTTTPTVPTVPEPATESTLNKTNQLNVEDAAPNYPSYKYKGCWSYGNDTQYPILSKMVVSNISNMDDCVGKISQVGLPSVAYDGKSLCFGGDNSYSEYNSTNCESTYGQGKSWLVYSKNN